MQLTILKGMLKEKKKKKDSDRSRAVHKDTLARLHNIKKKLERNVEDVDEMVDRQFKFKVT